MLGLGPKAPLTTLLNDQNNLNGDDPAFSYFLTESSDSFLEYGPYDPSQITSGDATDITWVPQLHEDDLFWTNEITGIKFDGGEYFDSISFSLEPYRASTYTSGECIMGPREYIKQLKAILADAIAWPQ